MKITGSTVQQIEKGKSRSRCRKWRLWVTTDHGRKSRRFTGTYTSAQDALKAFEAELGELVPNPDSFAAYAESWQLWREKSGRLSPNMIAKDRRNVTALCRTELARMRMDAVTPEDCRNALLWLREHPVSGNGELAGSTMENMHVTLSGIFKQAVGDGKLARNPMEGVSHPKVRKPERNALSPEEIALLLNRIDRTLELDAHVMALYLIICLGLRRGEALALQDEDVRDGFARIHLAVKEADGTVGEPKSEAGKRTLPVPARLQAKVDEWRAARESRGLAGAPRSAATSRAG